MIPKSIWMQCFENKTLYSSNYSRREKIDFVNTLRIVVDNPTKDNCFLLIDSALEANLAGFKPSIFFIKEIIFEYGDVGVKLLYQLTLLLLEKRTNSSIVVDNKNNALESLYSYIELPSAKSFINSIQLLKYNNLLTCEMQLLAISHVISEHKLCLINLENAVKDFINNFKNETCGFQVYSIFIELTQRLSIIIEENNILLTNKTFSKEQMYYQEMELLIVSLKQNSELDNQSSRSFNHHEIKKHIKSQIDTIELFAKRGFLFSENIFELSDEYFTVTNKLLYQYENEPVDDTCQTYDHDPLWPNSITNFL